VFLRIVVGEGNLLENVRNGADGQKTDANTSEPAKTINADIVKKGTQRTDSKPLESEGRRSF
jgi:hypothetical protein